MARKETLELMEQAIKQVFDKKNKESVNNNISVKTASVIAYDKERCIATISLIEDLDNNEYELYNKTGEVLEENDTVKVYYTTNVAKGWIGMKCGAPSMTDDSPPYISAKLTNQKNVNYNRIDRNILSVDFHVDDNDSDVVFSANQLCDVTTSGELTTYYKVDGTTQEFKPIETLDEGKRVVTYIYPMTLPVGSHNFSVYVLSENGGRGSIKMGGLVGVLSGQISGLRDIAPPNNDLLMYLNDVPAGTVIEIPRLISQSGTKIVDWGDGSEVEESDYATEINHTYESRGDYTITIKCDGTQFQFQSSSTSNYSSIKPYLTGVYFPDNATYIRWSYYLKDCTKLETVYLGKNITNLTLNLDNTKVSSLIFPETIQYIDVSLDNTSISSLVIPKNVSSARDFYSMDSLTSIEFKNKSLSSCRSCKNLVKVVMNDNITKVPDLYFSGCTSLNDVKFSQNITVIGTHGFDHTSITELPLLPKLTTVGTDAFGDCVSLTKVTFGDNLKTIGSSAFIRCTSLDTIDLPEGLTTIGTQAFYNSSATFTDFPSSLTEVGQQAFLNCEVEKGKMVAGCTYGYEAFKQSRIVDLEIESGVSEIPNSCFLNCNNAGGRLVFPNSVRTIGSSAFNGTTFSEIIFDKGDVLDGVVLQGVEKIEDSAFANCNNITKIEFPYTASNLGSGIFQNCLSLTEVVFPKVDDVSLKTGESMFLGCLALSKVTIGSVTEIANSSFYKCSSLEYINLVDDVKPNSLIIGSSAFAYSGLSSVNLTKVQLLPENSTTTYSGYYNIGKLAFKGCSNLTQVQFDSIVHRYKYDVGVIKTVKTRPDKNSDWSDPVETDLGRMDDAWGIYSTLGATEDNIFSETGLKNKNDYLPSHSEFVDISTDTYYCKYSVYDIK